MPIALALGALALASCGGSDDEGEAAAPPANQNPAPGGGGGGGGGGSANQSPTIGGTPPTSVMQGTEFAFTPNATDPEGDALTFAIVNAPPWANFDASTGELRGTPSSGDIGNYPDIQISVSDGTNTATLPSFSVAVVATATGSAVLSWTPPTLRSDGSPLNGDLAGFKIYWGKAPGNYPNSVTISNPGVASHVIDELTPGTWHFVATAFDKNGVESPFSNMATKQIL